MTATDTYLLLRAFCDELARCGLEHAGTSPGSAMPGLEPISTNRVTRPGSASATWSASRPPIEYPTSSKLSGASAATSSITPSSDTGRRDVASPCPRLSGASGR